ncbi:MAG: cytidylate kinase-like family protein [Lachnospira sp.]|nr:cytidylate kinase-like family protein [Lachnospira sp.]
MIITISRETGSGGHTIGKMLAEKLGYQFYDKEIIDEVAKEMGVSSQVVEENGETMSEQTYIDLASGFIPFSRKEKIPFEEIRKKQDKLILDIAQRGNGVIVGRGADFILRDREDAFHVFVHANMEHRVKRVQRHDGIENQAERIERELKVKDRSREMYYQYFTGREWGKVTNYNFTIDVGRYTKTQCVELIVDALEKMNGEKNHA